MQFTFSDLLVISLISAMIPVILFLEIELRILFCVFFEKKRTWTEKKELVHTDAKDIDLHVV